MSDIKTPIVPGSAEHDAAMIALAESQGVRIRTGNATSGTVEEIVAGSPSDPSVTPVVAPVVVPPVTGDKPVRPANVPEKFWNAETGVVNTEALLQSYTELESGKSKAAAKPVVAVNPLEAPSKALVAAQAKLAAATDDAGKTAAQTEVSAALAALSEAVAKPVVAPVETPEVAATTHEDVRSRASEELAKDGKLSDGTYAAAEKLGWDRATVDAYVDGQKARAEIIEMKVYNEAGGKDQYAAMSAWAKANWTPAQLAAHNQAVQSGNLELTLGAIRTMRDANAASAGTDATTRIEPAGGGGNGVVDMYRSKEEFQRDVANPLYQKGDRVFHAQVDRKLEAAMKANIDLGF